MKFFCEEVTLYICPVCGHGQTREDIEDYNMKYCPICGHIMDLEGIYHPHRTHVVKPRPVNAHTAYLKYLVGRFGRLESEIQEREEEKSRILEQLFIHTFPEVDFHSGRYSKHNKEYEE